MSDKDTGSGGKGTQQAPPKPTPPSGRVLKEGQQPPSKPGGGSQSK